jgi:hypothetical protein
MKFSIGVLLSWNKLKRGRDKIMIFIFLKGRRLGYMQKDITSATEYKIGNTTYIVNVKFAPNCKENISDVVRRLIERDIKKQAA